MWRKGFEVGVDWQVFHQMCPAGVRLSCRQREAKTEAEAEVVLRRAHLLQQNTGSPSVDDTGSDPTFRAGHTGPTRLELATVAVVEPPTQSSSSSIA